MNRFVVFLLLVAAACVGTGCASSGGQVAQKPHQEVSATDSTGVPAMEVPETSYDFGAVKDTEGEVVHEFKIKNVGTGVLRLKKVLPG